MPRRCDCWVIASADQATFSTHFFANSASPYSSISCFEFRPELALDAYLDPEALAVVAVLVALIEALQRLVALEDVLERAAPHVVHTHALVGRDRAVDEAENRAAFVLRTELLEDAVALPPLEDLALERRVVGNARQLLEHRRVSVVLGSRPLSGVGTGTRRSTVVVRCSASACRAP